MTARRVTAVIGVPAAGKSSLMRQYMATRDDWLRPGKADLICRGQTEYTMTPAGEAAFLLRHAYPRPEDQL